jgi:small subunit ribosomal protein S5
VLDLSDIRDILAKSLGSSNRLNVVKATVAALKKLRSREEIAADRQVEL